MRLCISDMAVSSRRIWQVPFLDCRKLNACPISEAPSTMNEPFQRASAEIRTHHTVNTHQNTPKSTDISYQLQACTSPADRSSQRPQVIACLSRATRRWPCTGAVPGTSSSQAIGNGRRTTLTSNHVQRGIGFAVCRPQLLGRLSWHGRVAAGLSRLDVRGLESTGLRQRRQRPIRGFPAVNELDNRMRNAS